MGEEKMSKSLGNVLSLPDVIHEGFSPLDLRYYLLSVHYRTNLKFTVKGLEEARAARRTLVEWMIDKQGAGLAAPTVQSGRPRPIATSEQVIKHGDAFDAAMNSDLNTPRALAAIFDCFHLMNRSVMPDASTSKALVSFIEKIRHTFGCFEPEELDLSADVLTLLTKRDEARKVKDFHRSDELRDEILEKGYEVKDTAEGQKLRKA